METKATDLFNYRKEDFETIESSQREYMRQQRDIEVLCTLHHKKAITY